MGRHIITLGLVLLIGGCQSTRRSNPPVDIDSRLSGIERSRLASAGADHASPVWFPSAPAGRAESSGQLSLIENTDADLDAMWALADVGEEIPEIDITSEQEEEAYWNDKAALYNRRLPLNSFWDTLKRDLKEMPGDLWQDTKLVYANPINLAILTTAYGGSMTLRWTDVDRTVEKHFRRPRPFGRTRIHRHMSSEWRDVFATAGNPGTHFGLAGVFYLIGQQNMDEKTYEVGKTLFSALIINGVTVMAGQAAHWDRGPNGEIGTMPSGHTSSSFVVASVLHEAYGHAVGIPLYALAALNAHERLESSEHYLSDVVMGAVLGTLVGHSVASGRDPEIFGWQIVPWVSPERGTGIGLMKTLP